MTAVKRVFCWVVAVVLGVAWIAEVSAATNGPTWDAAIFLAVQYIGLMMTVLVIVTAYIAFSMNRGNDHA